MKQPEVIQLAVTKIVHCTDPPQFNEDRITERIELAYEELKLKAANQKLTLVGVNQTIQTVLHENNFLFTIVLVGSAVDAEAVAQQQRLQQFDPRAGLKH